MSKLVNKVKVFSPEDSRDYKYTAEKVELPEEYIPESILPITDQFWSSMCVAHALSTTMSYCERKAGLVPNEYSKGFIYGNRNGKREDGEGMVTRDAIKILHKEGGCPHKYFRWHMSNVGSVVKAFKKDEDRLQLLASPYRLKEYIRLTTVEEIKQAVYKYGACVLCYPTRKSNKTYIEPATDKATGSHAITVIGWTKDHFILQNSWGKLAGEGGLFYMNYDYDWEEAWALVIYPTTERDPAPKGDEINDFFFTIKEVFVGIGYGIKWLFNKISKKDK